MNDHDIRPKYPRERFGAVVNPAGDLGNYFPMPVVPGWQVAPQDVQPPGLRVRQRLAGIIIGDADDQDDQPPLNIWRNAGWEVQSVQPPGLRIRQREAGVLTADASDQNDQPGFRFWYNNGWEIQSIQPPAWPKIRVRAGGMVENDDVSISDEPPITKFINFGFENQPPQPPIWPMVRQRFSATIGNDDAGMGDSLPIFLVRFADFQVQPPQPPARINFPGVRAGALMRGDDGAYATEILFYQYGFPIQTYQPQRQTPEKRAGAIARGDDGNYFKLLIPFQEGWAIQPPQPPHPIPERRAAALMRGEDGTEAIEFVYIPIFGWDIQHLQPPHFRPEIRTSALARGDDGNELTFYYPRYNFELPFLSLNPKPRFKSPEFGSQGIEAPVPIPYVGWDSFLADPVPHRRWPSGIMQATTLIEYQQFVPDVAAWTDLNEPLRYRRFASAINVLNRDLVGPVRTPWGYDYQETLFQRRSLKAFQTAVDSVIVRIPPIIWGFDATDRFTGSKKRTVTAVDRDADYFSPFPPSVWGYEAITPLFRARPHYPLDRGYEIVSSFPAYWASGWEVQPWQPPHIRRERSASLARWEDGTEQAEIVQFPNGWESVLAWPPHPRPERSASFMIGDVGAWAPLFFLVPSGATPFDFPVYYVAAWDIGQPPP